MYTIAKIAEEIVAFLTPVFISLTVAIVAYLFKVRIDAATITSERAEISREINRVTEILSDKDRDNDVLKLMIRNVSELREYYIINKQQATKSFSAALIISFLGFILFASGIVFAYLNPGKSNTIAYSTIGGLIVEVVAGLFFWLYSKAIKQINIFHASLQSTEKFLTAIQLVDKLSTEKRDDTYKVIIEKIISYNFHTTNNDELD